MVENFNGFTIVHVENERSVRKKFYPIDIIYRPVKNWPYKIVQCYFTTEIHLAYWRTFYNGDKIKYSTARQSITAQSFMIEKISMIDMLKIAQEKLVRFMILACKMWLLLRII